MNKVDRFARYLSEGFGSSVVVFRADGVPAGVQQSLDRAPAAIVVARPGIRMAQPDDLQSMLRERGLNVPFAGWVTEETGPALIAVFEKNSAPPLLVEPPDSLRVVAFMPAYNEADIIDGSLRYLIAQGIEVYLIDNWSTDGTYECAQEYAENGLIGIERFPADAPADKYEWRSILGRVEALSREIDADWFLLHDADERRHSPWAGVGLKAALQSVDRCGFNCIDHVVLNYPPVDNTFDPGRDVEGQFRYYSFSDHFGHFHQRKVWKNSGCAVSLASTAGHDIRFPGRLVYPFKFLMKHYPIRSQAHGEIKVFRDRAGRWSEAERSLGWHQQYDNINSVENFLADPSSLESAEGTEFEQKFLIERLSGIGVFREIPEWATQPRQQF